MNIKELWFITLSYGYFVRKYNKSGLEQWQAVKQYLSDAVFRDSPQGLSINPKIKTIICNHYKLNQDKIDHNDVEFVIDNVTMKNSIELHHFFIQHFRIPALNENLSVLKFAQIAYNAGQFLASIEQYDDQVKAFYELHRLHDVHTFVTI